jgi:hypothetical protein
MTQKYVALTDFLTKKELCEITALSVALGPMSTEFLDQVEGEIIKPNLDRINRSLGQENDSRYLAYAVAFVFSRR